MSYTARVMRGVIIDHVRNRRAQKRGGQFELTTLDTAVAPSTPDAAELTRLSDALDELAGIEPELAQVVDLKFFCGFSFVEIAAMQDVSERTVQRNLGEGAHLPASQSEPAARRVTAAASARCDL